MKAIVYDQYGTTDVMRMEEVPTPSAAPDEVLVRVHATTVNSYDWDLLTASTWVSRIGAWNAPKHRILGCDVAGVVEEVGSAVTTFHPGDEVMGDLTSSGFGGFARYVAVKARTTTHKPAELSFEEAACLPHTGTLALQALAKGKVREGSHVLINGGGGGAGTLAIQMAKNAGANVTAVDSAMKLDLMRGLGADEVLDYRSSDFTRSGQRYDLIIDVMSRRFPSAYRRVLTDDGAVVLLGGKIRYLLAAVTIGQLRKGDRRMSVLVHTPTGDDMRRLADLASDGTIRPAIDRIVPLEETPDALASLGAGESLGKIVIVP